MTEEILAEVDLAFCKYFSQLARAASEAMLSLDLLYSHTQLTKRYRATDTIRVEHRRAYIILGLDKSSAQSYKVISGITAEHRHELTEELQLWRIALLWSIAVVIYPTNMAPDPGAKANIHELPNEDMYLQDFSYLVDYGGLTGSDFLDLHALGPGLNTKPGSQVGSLNWLLVLLTELIRGRIVPVMPDLLDAINTLLQQSYDEKRAGSFSAGSSPADYATDQMTPSGRLKIVGALATEAYVESIRGVQAGGVGPDIRGPVDRPPVIATDQSDNPGRAPATILPHLVAATAGYVEALCGDNPDYVDTLAPNPSSLDLKVNRVAGPWIRLRYNHIATFRFIKHVAAESPGDVAGSGLPESMEKLIVKLDVEDEELRQAARDAREALTSALTTHPGVTRVPNPSFPIPLEDDLDYSLKLPNDRATVKPTVTDQDSSLPQDSLDTRAFPNLTVFSPVADHTSCHSTIPYNR